jgi:hypothetical protein
LELPGISTPAAVKKLGKPEQKPWNRQGAKVAKDC